MLGRYWYDFMVDLAAICSDECSQPRPRVEKTFDSDRQRLNKIVAERRITNFPNFVILIPLCRQECFLPAFRRKCNLLGNGR